MSSAEYDKELEDIIQEMESLINIIHTRTRLKRVRFCSAFVTLDL